MTTQHDIQAAQAALQATETQLALAEANAVKDALLIAQLEREVERLTVELAACEDQGPLPPPPESAVLWGGSVGQPTPANTPKELDIYRNKTKPELLDFLMEEQRQLAGIPQTNLPLWDLFHGFSNGYPVTWQDAECGRIATPRRMGSIQNVKADWAGMASGAYDSRVRTFVQSCPRDLVTYLVYAHEPENDHEPFTAQHATMWRAAVAKHAALVVSARGILPVIPVICVMNWSVDPDNRPFDENWLNPAAELEARNVSLDDVVFTVDGYDTSPVSLAGVEDLYGETSQQARAWGFTRYGVSEGACKSYSPADRAVAPEWVETMADLAVEERFEYAAWFNSGAGNRAGSEGWWLYGTEAKAEFGRTCLR